MGTTIDRAGEIDVGMSEEFEQRWWRIEKIGWGVMLVFVLLGLSGLFGRGPLSRTTAEAPDGSASVKYERYAHNHTPSEVAVTLRRAALQPPHATVWLSRELTDGMPVSRVIPEPVSAAPRADGTLYTFDVPTATDSATVHFVIEPGTPFRKHGQVRAGTGAPAELSIFVYP
jgi:hypothetical protein